MKRVSFGAKKIAGTRVNQIDAWVENRELLPPAPVPREPMKRLTIDVPIQLHKRIKSQCAMQNLVMADVIRELLERRFPAPAPEPEEVAS